MALRIHRPIEGETITVHTFMAEGTFDGGGKNVAAFLIRDDGELVFGKAFPFQERWSFLFERVKTAGYRLVVLPLRKLQIVKKRYVDFTVRGRLREVEIDIIWPKAPPQSQPGRIFHAQVQISPFETNVSGIMTCKPQLGHMNLSGEPIIESAPFKFLPFSINCTPPISNHWNFTLDVSGGGKGDSEGGIRVQGA